MKIIKILLNHSKNMTEDSIKAFLYKNMPAEIINGLEYDDPKTIERVLKLLKIESKPTSVQEAAGKKVDLDVESEKAVSA